MIRRLPLLFTPQPEGGFTVTSPALPELITEGDTFEDAFANVGDALSAVLELYAEEGRAVPPGIELPQAGADTAVDRLRPSEDPDLKVTFSAEYDPAEGLSE